MKKLLIIVALVAFLSIGAIAIAPAGEYNVTFAGGYVYDIDTNDPVSGANVSVHCVESNETRIDTTDANGYYLVTIPCSTNDTLQITAAKNSDSGSNSGTVEYLETVTMGTTEINIGVAQVDITIPEFPVAALPALLSMFSFGLVRKRLF